MQGYYRKSDKMCTLDVCVIKSIFKRSRKPLNDIDFFHKLDHEILPFFFFCNFKTLLKNIFLLNFCYLLRIILAAKQCGPIILLSNVTLTFLLNQVDCLIFIFALRNP